MRDLVPLLLALLALVGTFALRASVAPFPLVLAEDGPGVAAATFWMGARDGSHAAQHYHWSHCGPRLTALSLDSRAHYIAKGSDPSRQCNS
jgi:hypothetical protein